MTRTIKLDQNPYDDRVLFEKSSITLHPGITVLVGCNGSGKTTLLHYIQKTLRNNDIPYLEFNNLSASGGQQIAGKALLFDDTKTAATAILSSEGEKINIAIGKFITNVGRFIRTHRDAKEIWLLFDAVDSGLSLDNIEDIKGFFKEVLLPDIKGADVYIVLTANQYAVAEGEDCLDVQSGNYTCFDSYTDYKRFILESKQKKEDAYALS